MPVSHYFNNQPKRKTTEQTLYEDLLCESIKISGMDIYYIPRSSVNDNDLIFGENVQSLFDRAYIIDMYPLNVDGHEGDGDIFNSFGMHVRDLSNFVVARRTFRKIVPTTIAEHPDEGDLLYVPFLNKLFEIRWVEAEYPTTFHTLGIAEPYVYSLRAEAYRYSHERLETGVTEIDQIEKDTAYAVSIDLGNGSGIYRIGEIVYQGANAAVANAQATVKDWDGITNTLQIINVYGSFSNTENVVGETSGAEYELDTADIIGDYNERDLINNSDLQTEANSFIVLTENNPFGAP